MRAAGPQEDLRSVTAWFQKSDLPLSRIRAADKRAINSDYSVLVVTGSADKFWFGIFVVYGGSNQIYIALEANPAPRCCVPRIKRATEESVYIEWFGDYGSYGGTSKYTYNLRKRHAPQRYTYRRFSVQTAQAGKSELTFAGAYTASSEIESDRWPGEIKLVRRLATRKWYARKLPAELPLKQEPAPTPAVPDDVPNALSMLANGNRPESERIVRAKDGLWLYVAPVELSGVGRGQSGVYVVRSRGKAQFYPVPVPAIALYDRLRRNTGAVAFTPGPSPGGLVNGIGPFAFDGEKLWFANRFYDGEGTSGVGAVGSFDPVTRKYEMRYLPEIAPWSSSVLALHRDSVWIGLMRQPEGDAFGGGVLQFDKQTGSSRVYPIHDLVTAIIERAGELYFAATEGVYIWSGKQELSQVRVEPGPAGPYQIVMESIPLTAGF